MDETVLNEKFKSGMVSIVGRPNVGKSTLLNRIVGEKVAIVSNVPQTTRNQIRGIYTDERGQIVFIDTPGFHGTRDKLDEFMNNTAFSMAKEADCLIHLVDARDSCGKEEEEIARRLNQLSAPVILGLNKIDLKPKHLNEYIALWEKVKGKPVTEMDNLTLLPLSGHDGTNVEKLIDLLFEHLSPGPALYPTDIVCDIPQKMVLADIIREKLFHVLRQEVPHAVAVIIDQLQPRKGKALYIQATVIVEKDSQKAIVIGKSGETLKKVGTLARKEIEDLLEQKIFVEIFVKTKKNWRDNSSLLQEMGYQDI